MVVRGKSGTEREKRHFKTFLTMNKGVLNGLEKDHQKLGFQKITH